MSNFEIFRRHRVSHGSPIGPLANSGLAAESVFLVGLGRFGIALAESLMELNVSVMAIDTSQSIVDTWAERLTHVRVADGTSTLTLEQLGVEQFDAAVVAIGTGIEASILTTAALSDLGVKNIWAKAITNEHGSILQRVGADHVVYPERQMGERVAHAVSGQVLDYFQVDDGFVLAELEVPAGLGGQTLGASQIRQRFAVTVVCLKPSGGSFNYATADTVLGLGDIMLVAGEVAEVERFAEFASK